MRNCLGGLSNFLPVFWIALFREPFLPAGWGHAIDYFSERSLDHSVEFIGLLVVAVYPPWGKYYGVCLMGILFGMVLVLSGEILKRIHQNILSYGSLHTGELADISALGWFYILTIRFQAESAVAMTRKVVVPKRIAIFLGIEKLTLGTDVKLLYLPGYFKPVLLLPVVFYRIQMG